MTIPIVTQRADFLSEVENEFHHAKAKFPDSTHSMAELNGEVGELARAMVGEPAENVRREAVQVAVMAMRVALEGDSSLRTLRNHKGLDTLPFTPPPSAASMKMIELTRTSTNLFALASFIEENVPPERIEMSAFVTKGGREPVNTGPNDLPKNECGTAFCALGWEAVRVPEVAARFLSWQEFRNRQFPGLNTKQEATCFSGVASSNKDRVLEALRKVAAEAAEVAAASA